jgi:hypothetical protein
MIRVVSDARDKGASPPVSRYRRLRGCPALRGRMVWFQSGIDVVEECGAQEGGAWDGGAEECGVEERLAP